MSQEFILTVISQAHLIDYISWTIHLLLFSKKSVNIEFCFKIAFVQANNLPICFYLILRSLVNSFYFVIL